MLESQGTESIGKATVMTDDLNATGQKSIKDKVNRTSRTNFVRTSDNLSKIKAKDDQKLNVTHNLDLAAVTANNGGFHKEGM